VSAALVLEIERLRRSEREANQRAEQAEERTRRFQQIVSGLGRALAPEQVADVVMVEVSRALAAKAAVIYQLQPDGSALALLCSSGYTEESTRGYQRLPLEFSSPITDAMRRREAVWVESWEDFRRGYPELAGRFPEIRQGAWVAVPLLIEERALGVLAMSFADTRTFQEAERVFALAVAQQCAQALERALLYQALERARQQIAAIIAASPLAILLLDGEGTVGLWNPAATSIFGWQGEEVSGHCLPMVALEGRSGVLEHLRAASRGAPVVGHEARFIGRGGKSIDVVYWVSALSEPGGAGQCILIAADDTRRKEAERHIEALNRELRRQLDEFQTLLDVIPVGIGIARDPQCRHIQQNPWSSRLLGVTTDRNISLSAPEAERLHHVRVLQEGRELRSEEMPIQRAAATGREVLDFEIDIDVQGKRRVTLVSSAVPLFDEAHQPRGAIGTFLDITARKRNLEAQRFLAESSAALSASLEPERTLRELARLCVPALGSLAVLYGRGASEGLDVLATAHEDPELEALVAEASRRSFLFEKSPLQEVLVTGLPRLILGIQAPFGWGGATVEEQAAVGQRLGLRSVMLVPLITRHGDSVVLMLGTPERDYTEEEQAFVQQLALHAALALDNARLHQEVQQAVALREVFLGVAGHELRTPLTALNLGLQGLARQAASMGEAAALLSKRITSCQKQGQRLARLINDLLDVSRISAGKLPMVLEEVDLSALVDEVMARMETEFEKAGCALSVSQEPHLVGRWDRSRLDQVVTNLLSNAVKYGQGRPIEVSVVAEDDGACLRVRDEGIGISPEDQARVFERFERAVAERHYGGLGLGLWISRQIVHQLGGCITLHSQPGHGSTFEVHLPWSAPDRG
jgi:PAS domain S-box-containing protein